MQSLSSALLLLCLQGGVQLHVASAGRVDSHSSVSVQTDIHRHESWKYKKEEKPVQKCVYEEDLVLQCPEAGRVTVVTAFWNRRKKKDCMGEKHDINAGLGCDPNATDKVIEMCQGQDAGSCIIPRGSTGCQENPFTFMRVRWQCSKSGDSKPEEAVEEVLGMDGGDNPQMDLPTLPKRVTLNENDPDVQKWEKTPERRLGVTSLKKEHCNSLQVGAWPKVGETGCEVAAKVSDFAGSTPHFYEDSVCACYFWTPPNIKKLATDCDTIFPNPTSVYKTQAGGKRKKGKKGKGGKEVKEGGSIAIFGKEGCDCHPSPEQGGWTVCDLAVREV